MNEYITVAELKDSMGIEITTHDTFIGRVCESASRAIDRYCRRRFWVNPLSETRYFTAESPDVLRLRDLVQLSALKTDTLGVRSFTETWSSTDYLLAPYNAALDGEPYDTIERDRNSSYRFPTLARGVQVTGKFGWPAVPADVVSAAEILARRYFDRKGAALGVVSVGTDGVSIRIGRGDSDVTDLLEPFRLHTSSSLRLS